MQIDLRADFLDHVVAELQALGVQPPSNDLTECALLLFKLERRCPHTRPRNTALAATFKVPAELQRGFDRLVEAIHRGDPLKPYLSRQTFNPAKSDGLLDDWGILHFHLGENMQASGLISGTKDVAFALVNDACVYFIDSMPHGPDHPDTWVQENLVHLIDQNWPELLPSSAVGMTPDQLSLKQRRNLRKKRVNVTVSNTSGGALFAPGGGFMSNGTAMADVMKLQRLYAELDYLEALFRQYEAAIREALGEPESAIKLQGRFCGGYVRIYASNGAELQLIQATTGAEENPRA